MFVSLGIRVRDGDVLVILYMSARHEGSVCCSIFSFLYSVLNIIVCLFFHFHLFFLLVIVLSVFIRTRVYNNLFRYLRTSLSYC